jgi:hypothetical protein
LNGLSIGDDLEGPFSVADARRPEHRAMAAGSRLRKGSDRWRSRVGRVHVWRSTAKLWTAGWWRSARKGLPSPAA